VVEALKIGFGGFAYVARVLGMSRRTIYTGIGELEAMGNEDHPPPQRPRGGAKHIRRPGGGRHQVTQRQPGLGEVVDEVLEAHSAGSPTDEAVRWTDLVLVQLAQQVPARAGYRRRSLRKALSTGDVDLHERDRQFRLIATWRRQARARGVPVLCVDTRKKERLGHLYRRGSCYSTDVRLGSAEPTVRAASAGGSSTRRTPPSGIRSSTVCFVMSRVA